jgi:hypothetical protein
MPIDVQMPDGTIITGVPDNITQAELLARYKAYVPPTPEPASAGFSASDLGVAFGQGAIGSTKALTDVAGATNVASQSLEEAQKDLTKRYSPERQAEMQRQAARMKAAEESGSTLAEIKAGALNVLESPLQSTAQAVGSFVPYLPAMFAAPAAAVLGLGTRAVTAITSIAQQAPKVMATAQGAGAVKGAIYDGVYQAEIEAGVSPELAKKKAEGAQEYFGSNFDQIALGTGIGLLTGSTGIERLITPAGRAAASKNIAQRVGTTAVTEALPEGVQEGQERAAQNIALQREGYDVDTFAGVAGGATQGALMGALGAGPIAAVMPPGAERAVTPPKDSALSEEEQRARFAFLNSISSGTEDQIITDENGNKVKIPGQLGRFFTPEEQVEYQKLRQKFAPTATPPQSAPPSSAQDTQAMIDEISGLPPVAPPADAIPPADTTPPSDKVPSAAPVGNEIWESIQNRDRSTPASIAQMTNIANEPDYSRVSMSRDYGTGAPIVAGSEIDSIRLGRTDTVTGADGKKVPIQYGVIEAGEVIASHNADGTKNPSYIDQSVPAFRAITNGRVAGLQAAYNQGTANDYRTALLSDDLHGVSREVIEGMQNPMLVRVMPMDQVNKNTGDVSNTGAGLTFNFVEQAKNDTNRVDLSKITFTDNGDVTPQTIRDFVAAMPTTEQGNLMGKDGNPTKQAVDRVNAAIFQQAYNNDKLTELAFQAQDEEARNIVRALNMAASKAIRLGEAGDYDVRPLVNEAVELAINARRNNMSLKDVVAQGDLTANPLTKDIVQMFADNPRSAKAIGENLSNLFDNAFAESSKTDEDMFGAVPKRPVDELIRDSFAKKVEPDLFDEKQPVVEEKEPKDFDISKTEFEIHQEIKDLDSIGLAKWLVANARNKAAKYIAEKIEQQITKFEKAGVKVNIIMLNGKDRHKRGVQGTSGLKLTRPGRDVYYDVKLNGLNTKGKADDSTIGYQIIMHELLHTVSQLQIYAIRDKKTQDYQEIQKDLASILRAVRKQNKLEREKDAFDQHNASYQSRFYKNTDELFAYGLSNSSLQDYLSTIKMGDKTAFTKLVEIVRKLLGISSEYDTALDKLMRVGDRVFQMSTDEIADIAKQAKMNFGEGVIPDSAATNIDEAAPIPSKGLPNIIKKLITKKQPEATQEPTKAEKPAADGRNYLGQPVAASWAFPEDRFIKVPGAPEQSIDKLLYIFQDKQIDLKRAQEGIAKAAGEITDNINAYDKEQLFHGKVATGIRNFLLNELMPAIKKIKESKLTTKDMQDYLLARHAEERNDRMNELNKLDPRTGEPRKTPWELQDRASGMSTDKAREYLKNLDPAKKQSLETIGKMFDKMITGTQQILVESGSESQATIDAWNEAYEHYMPLFRVEEDFNNGGNRSGLNKGFNVNNPFSKRAMGSAKEVQNIVTNLIKQRERALIRAEKLTVTKALYGLFLMNPNPDIALPVNPDAIKSKDALIAELQGLGYENAAEIANNLMEEPKSRYISKNRVIDKDTGLPTSDTEESVKLRIDSLARFGDNVLTLRVDGKNRYIFFNQANPNAVRMAASLKSLDTESLGSVMSIVAKGTRWFANVNTQYNPIFAAVNLIRDIGSAQVNLTTTPLAGKQAQVTAGIFPAMRGIFKILRAERSGEVGGNSEMEKAFREFREAGGQTGYRDALARKESEQSIVDDLLKTKTLSGNALQAMKSVFGALSDFNDTLENSIRLSAYIQASKPKSEGGLGLSKQQAAVIAKNLTVNFDKKGQISANVNALYAFFNASVQGTARLATTLTGPKGKAIIGGGILLGTIQSVLLAAAGFRDDEPPEFVKQRNFVIPTPDGNYLTIPYPLGFNLLPNIGRITTEFMISGGKNPAKRAGDLMGSVADAFSPIGSSGLSMQTIAPTVLDPLAALEANKDAFGRPIYKEDRATNPTPGYLRSRENASEMNKAIAYFFNVASGGTKYSKGFFSPTADELDYVVGQVTGGLGREIMKTGQTIKAAGTGEDLPAYRVPLLGRFYGETESNAAESQRFYNNITRMADHENEIKGRIKNKESVASYYRDNPEARLYQQANTIENQINALNKQKKEFIEKDLPKDRIKRIENQKALIMKRFNDQLAKFED